MKFPQLISLRVAPPVFIALLPLSVASKRRNVGPDELLAEMYPLHQRPYAIELEAEAALSSAVLPGTPSQSLNILGRSSFRVGG